MRAGASPLRRAAPFALLLLLAACAHAPPRPSPAAPQPTPAPTVLPTKPPDVRQIPDAVPRDEPRSAFGNPPFYEVAGHRYVVLANASGYLERGVASWYGTEFHGLRTSTGEPYDMFAMTAAHKTLPLPCYARVTNLSNGRSVVVRINDRGPFVANRIVDLSYTAAVKLDMIRAGTAFVQVEALTPASSGPTASVPVTTAAASAANVGVSSVPAISVAAAAASAPATAAAASIPAQSATFYIQVGAYSQADNAQRAAQRLRDAGVQHVFMLAPDAGQSLQRVRIGPITSVEQFDTLVARLDALGFTSARLAQD